MFEVYADGRRTGLAYRTREAAALAAADLRAADPGSRYTVN